MLVAAKDVQVGDILVQDEFFRDRVEEVEHTPMGLVKLRLNGIAATMFFTPNETILIARPKTVALF
jgi:hypothetical protein